MRSATDLLVWGAVAHFIGDFLLQNAWMADNKANLRHPAAWVHSGIQFFAAAAVFSWPLAGGIAICHLLIDTRRPLQWWRRVFRQTTAGPMAAHVAIWGDQTLHCFVLAAAAAYAGRG